MTYHTMQTCFIQCNKRSETKCKNTILHKILDFLFKAQSGSRARRCRRNVTIVHVCMEVNAKKDGIDISVNVNTPASLDLLVEMVCLIKIVFIISNEIINRNLHVQYKLSYLSFCSCGNSEVPRKQLNEPKI